MQVIPLEQRAHFRFRTSLGGESYRFRFNWLTRYEYFTVDIERGDELIARGRALHPGINLFDGLDSGELVLEGAAPTPRNLGINNRLVYR